MGMGQQPGRDQRAERFEEIFDATADRLRNYCLRHTSPQQAEDVVSEVFAAAWRKLDQLPDPALPWLIVAARHEMASQYRTHKRQGQISERLAPLTALASDSPELGVERRDELLRALGSLSDDDREAMLLIAWDGLSTRDAARVLGTTPGALRVRIHRARTALRAQFDTTGATHA